MRAASISRWGNPYRSLLPLRDIMGPPTKINSPDRDRSPRSSANRYYMRARMHLASLGRSIDRTGWRNLVARNPSEWNCYCTSGFENVPVPSVFWLHSLLRCACPSVRPSVRPSVCLTVCLSVRSSVRCLPQRTSDECITVWPRPEGSLTDYHLVFMVFEVLLNHLAAFLLRVRLPAPPPSSNVPPRPRHRRRWRRHGVHGDRREENRRDEERCEQATRTADHWKQG